MKSVYQLITEAQEKINWETIRGIAAVLNTHYHWSEKGRLATIEEMKSLCFQLCFQAECQQQKNQQEGKGKNPIRISSGCWTVSVFYWTDSPFVSIDFGLNCNAQ